MANGFKMLRKKGANCLCISDLEKLKCAKITTIGYNNMEEEFVAKITAIGYSDMDKDFVEKFTAIGYSNMAKVCGKNYRDWPQ